MSSPINIDAIELLPATALVAVTLFIIREIMDFIRKRKEKTKRIFAVKALLGFELERNYYTMKRLFGAIKDIRESFDKRDDSEFYAYVSPTGAVGYRRKKKNDEFGAGWPIPPVHMSELERLLPSIAELDNKLFEKVMEMYEIVFELEHLRASLIRILTSDDDFISDHVVPKNSMLDGFSGYALGWADEMNTAFLDFYRSCTGKAEISVRMR